MGKINRRIFAIVIGINQYKDLRQLHGAVADADDVNDLLIQAFDANPKNIINLRDYGDKTANIGPATRENIIAKIRSLKDNSNIQKGDAIVIYFAGHGGRSTCADWKSPNSRPFIESICPVDIGSKTTNGKDPICGIPDFTFRVLLNELSQEKGNNITLILDSCHSGGANRDDEDCNSKGYYSRQYLNPPPIPQDCDSDIVISEARAAKQAPGFQGQDLDSHVAIAACSSLQSAFENRDSGRSRGIFTQALTTVLREKGATSEMTYISLISHISAKIQSQKKTAIQTPQLSGINVYRLPFHAGDQINCGDPSFLSGYRDGEQRLFLRAGSILGVEKDLELPIYRNNLSDKSNLNYPLGILTVSKVNTFDSILTFSSDTAPFDFDSVFFTRLPLCLRIYTEKKFREDIQHILNNPEFKSLSRRFSMLWSDDVQNADVKLEINDDAQLIFHRCSKLDQEIIGIIGTEIPGKVPTTDYAKISRIFQAIANYNRHLRTEGGNAIKKSVELHEGRLHAEEPDYIFEPSGESIVGEGDDTVKIVADDEKCYAVTINNPSKSRDLYAYLFIFDAGDFTIDPWYAPDTGGVGLHAEAPLKKGSKLYIGHGSEGVPYRFKLQDSSKKEVCFIKLYLSASPIDPGIIQQRSPFDELKLSKDDDRKGEAVNLSQEYWDTRVIRMIQIPASTSEVIETSVPTMIQTPANSMNLTWTGSKLCSFFSSLFHPSKT